MESRSGRPLSRHSSALTLHSSLATSPAPPLRQQPFDHIAVDVGEPKVTALEAVGEAFVIEPQAMEDGGVEIVNVDGILRHVVTELVGFPIGDPRLDPASGHPDGVIATVM